MRYCTHLPCPIYPSLSHIPAHSAPILLSRHAFILRTLSTINQIIFLFLLHSGVFFFRWNERDLSRARARALAHVAWLKRVINYGLASTWMNAMPSIATNTVDRSGMRGWLFYFRENFVSVRRWNMHRTLACLGIAEGSVGYRRNLWRLSTVYLIIQRQRV